VTDTLTATAPGGSPESTSITLSVSCTVPT
jgi:hypothetical protein